ncbi:hypothetical protein [Rhodococcus gannanensis]|uniref:HEAT repeat domain-containing protein n=1 Tax=Rhodococcus gannanensis TaxID=1960308 RepID=A0ABW4P408_9NOCA
MYSVGELDARASRILVAGAAGDAGALHAVGTWMAGLAAVDLVRMDQRVRRRVMLPQQRDDIARRWTAGRLAAHPRAALVMSMVPDGHVRERAVAVLAQQPGTDASRALALRTSDHVLPIRVAACAATLDRTEPDDLDAITPVLLVLNRFARDWRNPVLGRYHTVAGHRYEDGEMWALLRANEDRLVRRFAVARSIENGVLGPDDAAAAYLTEKDVVVQRAFGRLLLQEGEPTVTAPLLTRGVSASDRAGALARFDATVLVRDDVRRLLVDSSVLVRLWARRRWAEFGEDPVATYRDLADSATLPARARGRAWLGLREAGRPPHPDEIRSLIEANEPPLRAVALRLMVGSAVAGDVPGLVARIVAGTRGEARLATNVLAAQPVLWRPADLDDLWDDPDPETRRRAWVLERARGGWDAVVADLRACGDGDPALRAAALSVTAALPVHGAATPAHRDRIADLLPGSGLAESQRRAIAVSAGVVSGP